MAVKTYDSVIIGGGFAGISAAIYLARFSRQVLVIDNSSGRWNTHEINENYLGFPNGISTKELRQRGIDQAKRFSAEFMSETVKTVKKQQSIFISTGLKSEYASKTIIFATGVIDNFPHFPNWQEYVGKSLFWCITCDGYKTIGKKIVVIGKSNEAVCDALQFVRFTKKIVFITNQGRDKNAISDLWKRRLHHRQIPFYDNKITEIVGRNGKFEKLVLDKGEEIEFDFMISEQGAIPKSELALELGVKVGRSGFILADTEQRTNIPYVYAAGDITKEFSHQIATAVHEGSMAAQSVNYDLYDSDQKMD